MKRPRRNPKRAILLGMTSRARFISAAALAAFAFLGIAQTPARPEFEVATIKLNINCGHAGFRPLPGRLSTSCTGMRSLIQAAYGTFGDGVKLNPGAPEVMGGPAWLDSDLYDIEAKTQGNPPVPQMAGPMLQRLLENRCKLRVRKEIKEADIYALTVTSSGSKMKAPKAGSCAAHRTDGADTPTAPGEPQPTFCGDLSSSRNGLNVTVDGHSLTMYGLASRISALSLDRPVIDRTGLVGLFDIHLEYAWRSGLAAASPDADGPSIFTAIQEQLGLKLVPGTGPVDVFVIDHIERPSEN